MNSYWLSNWGPKIRTFARLRQHVSNWPTMVSLRVGRRWRGLRAVHFRDGVDLLFRGGTQDWDVICGLAVNDEYKHALDYVRTLTGSHLILDLGANIGVFSLLTAHQCPGAVIHAYEPAPANVRMVRLNVLANEELSSRIHVHAEAVGGQTRTAEFFYDALNPQASRIESGSPSGIKVQIRAFAEVVNNLDRPISLVKMDIESAEYELVQETPPEIWKRIAALSIELHPTPNGPDRAKAFLKKIHALGFDKAVPEGSPGCYFISRSRPLN